MNPHTPKHADYAQGAFTCLVWRGNELKFIERSDDFLALVKWAGWQIHCDALHGFKETSATITPNNVEV